MEIAIASSASLSFLWIMRLYTELQERKRRFRRWWVQQHLLNNVRDRFGLYGTLFSYFRYNNEEEFHKMMGISVQQFEEVHNLLKRKLEKCCVRRLPLPSELRLALTLKYFARGGSVESIARSFFVGKSTAFQIIKEVSGSIWEVLQPVHIGIKTEQQWLDIATVYLQKWGFPNCVGAIDGKHIRILQPPRSGSAFFNYKKFYSFVLLAACDADYKFTWVDIGDYGSISDMSVFEASTFYEALINKRASLPPPAALPGGNEVLPFSFIGDEIFTLSSFLMRPYTRRLATSEKEKLFNYRLSRARMTIENTFGILTARWRILRETLSFNLKTNISIVQAIVCLHNFLINSEEKVQPENRTYVDLTFVDQISINGNIIPGKWRQLVEDSDQHPETVEAEEDELLGKEDYPIMPLRQREMLANYFYNQEGFEST